MVFSIGDKVRVKAGHNPSENFTGIAIFQGDSTIVDSCYALERLDERTGGAQNNWWNFKKKNISSLELVSTSSTPEFQMYDRVEYGGEECVFIKEDEFDFLLEGLEKGWKRDRFVPENYESQLNDRYYWVKKDKVTLIKKATITGTVSSVCESKKTKMDKIVKFAKNLTLSKEEKLMRKHDLKDDCGDYTEAAREIVMQKLMQENEAKLIEIATEMEAEEKKK